MNLLSPEESGLSICRLNNRTPTIGTTNTAITAPIAIQVGMLRSRISKG